MNTIFEFSLGDLATPLVVATALALLPFVWRALRAPYLLRIGLRNVPRRPGRTLLIVFGLMLATTFVSTAIAIDATIVLAVKNVAVFNLGRLDEDIVGGQGPLGVYPDAYGVVTQLALAGDTQVAGIAPAFTVPDLLMADDSVRAVRGGVLGIGIMPDAAGPLGDLRSLSSGAPTPIQALGMSDIYLNRSVAVLLGAHVGDAISLYSSYWPGQRAPFVVRDIVEGGPLGDRPALIASLEALRQRAGQAGALNHIYIANTGDGISGVRYSNAIAERLSGHLPNFLRVEKVKQNGIHFALAAQETFGRILLLFTLFSLSIGLLLIFLIFVLLAAERRAELGVARALGMRRGQVVWALLFEGATYDLVAAALGTLAGLLLGGAIIVLVAPTVARLGFPLRVEFDPGSLIAGFCLGLLVTLATITLAAWVVSRMTIATALRDLPEPPTMAQPLWRLLPRAVRAARRVRQEPRAALAAWSGVGQALVTRGLAPLVLGAWLAYWAIGQYNVLALSIGLTGVLVGVVLVLRWLALGLVARRARRQEPARGLRLVNRATATVDRISALLIGGGLALYWALPFDVLRGLGLPRFAGDIDVLFVAGVMMVFGAVLAIVPSLALLFAPVTWALARLRRLRPVAAVALVYPASQRFRTGIGLALFSLICFTMVVMASVTASTTSLSADLPAQATGYDIIGQSLFTPSDTPQQVRETLRKAVSAAGGGLEAASAARPVPIGVIQPGTLNARWSLYPAAEMQGAFLDGTGFSLIARAPGFASDADVWAAVRDQPGDVVIDIGALSSEDAATLGVRLPPPATAAQYIGPPILSGLPQISSIITQRGQNIAPQTQLGLLSDFAAVASDQDKLDQFTLRLRYVAADPGRIGQTPLWIGDLRGGAVTRVTVIGLVANPYGLRRGLFGSPETFAPIEQGLAPFGNEYYYFALRPGADAHTAAYTIGSALLENGFETTVIQDILVDVNGPRLFISRILLGLVGITLLIGMAALIVIGSRAVVERRQQIGMLRALGFHRLHIALLFVVEALLIGGLGTGLGLVLGIVLCRNAFAVGFFQQFQTGLTLILPRTELAAISGAALLASLVAALLPAWQAGRVAPADALRYE
ncbi:MAG: FtsX-like permease family protein [Ktedonobacterales bacterium]|nr:FtsX-like permease family protein [Ktedonobacterales bacterium]